MLAEKQRQVLRAEKGEPVLTLEFDIFEDGGLSMWTHFEHGSDFESAKRRLIEIRDHLDSFISAQSMCPFRRAKSESSEESVAPDKLQCVGCRQWVRPSSSYDRRFTFVCHECRQPRA